MAILHPIIEAELRQLRAHLLADGMIPSREQLLVYYETFRRMFGPELLRSLDGQELLERMHAHGRQDSLVYWLEFKDDETFPAIFGSIAGGSALKFGVYRRRETGAWAVKASNSSAPQDIPLEQAIEIARRNRDQLLAAVKVLAETPAEARSDADYQRIQTELAAAAPDVQDTAWGHKYLSLLFPDLLDDFHSPDYQRYHLARTLQLPPADRGGWAEGRYVCAGRFVALARELDLPLHDLTTLLNRRNGPPRRYWRVGTTDDERARRKFWPLMRDGGIVAMGWPALGDLSNYPYSSESKERIAALLRQHYPGDPRLIGRSANQVMQFVSKLAEGDRVIASDGVMVLGVGEISGSYHFDPTTAFPHQRPVTWRSHEEWRSLDAEGLRTSVAQIKDPRNHVEIERHILEDAASVKLHVAPVPSPPVAPQITPPQSRRRAALPRLTGTPGLLQAVLERKGQAILYGPPGTGKTHWALRAARELAALRLHGVGYDVLDDAQRHRLLEGTSGEPSLVRVTSFHPEYGYEDFIEGYRPRLAEAGQLAFTLTPGVFRKLCADAAAAEHLDFYLVVDEINRGDVPRIFGELLTLLERDKRGQPIVLPASGEVFRVPPNVFLIGTMNTADRSIALLDVALRRRFGFVELMPDYGLLKGVTISGLPLGPWLEYLNSRIRSVGGGDSRNRQIGHAFLLGVNTPITTVEQLAAVLRDDIVPLLEEYCYDDFDQLVDLLGPTLVDAPGQRIRRELFEQGHGLDLVAALLRPEIATATPAVLTAFDGSADAQEDEDVAGSEDGLAPSRLNAQA